MSTMDEYFMISHYQENAKLDYNSGVRAQFYVSIFNSVQYIFKLLLFFDHASDFCRYSIILKL